MLKREQRLRATRQFRAVYARGRSHVHPLLVLHALKTGEPVTRFGFSVSKKLGGAVDRNRIKRRLREACRSRQRTLRTGYDLVLVARTALARAPYEQLCRALEELLTRARLIEANPALVGERGAPPPEKPA